MRRVLLLGLFAAFLASCTNVPIPFLTKRKPEPAPVPAPAPGDAASEPEPAEHAQPVAARPGVSASREVSVEVNALPEGMQGVELWVTDDGGLHWRAAGMTPGAPQALPFTAPRDGRYGFAVVSVAADGNRVQPPVPGSEPQVSVLIDTAPPVVVLESPNGGNVLPNRGQEWIRWTARDPNLAPNGVTLEASANGGRDWALVGRDLPNDGRAAWTLPVDSGKDWMVRVTARDLAGNTASDASDATFTIDGFPPEGRVLGPETASRGEVALQYTAGDPGGAGLAKVVLWTTTDGGATWQRAAEDVDTLSPMSVVLPDGEYGLALVCVDRVGNAIDPPRAGTKPASTLLVDTAAPVVAFYDFPCQSQPAGQAGVFPGDEDVPLAWTVSDANLRPDGVRLDISEDGGATWKEVASALAPDKPYTWRTPSKPGNASLLVGRRYRLRVTAEDRIGNASCATSPEFGVDGSIPEAYFTGPAMSGSHTVDVEYGVRNLGFAPLARVELWVMRGGDTHWERVAEDADCQSPVSFEAPDGVYGVKVTCATKRGIEKGRCQAAPEAGTPPDGRLVIDSAAPQVKLTSPNQQAGSARAPAIYRGGETVQVAWAAKDDHLGANPARIESSSNGGRTWKELAKGMPAEGIWRWTLPVETGDAFQVRVVVTDAAGNEGSGATERFGIDGKAPSARVVGPTMLNQASGSTARLSVEAVDAGPAGVGEVVLYRAKLGGPMRWEEAKKFTSAPYQADLGPLDDGRWGFVAVAADRLGNRGPAPGATTAPDLEIAVDAKPPAIRLVEPKGGEVYSANADIAIRWEAQDASKVAFLAQVSNDGGRTWTDVAAEAAGTTSCRWKTPPDAEGAWKVRVVGRDEAGNEASALTSADVQIDGRAPVALVKGPSRSSSGEVEVDYDVQDLGPAGPGTVQLWTRAEGTAEWRPGPSVDLASGKRAPLRVVLPDGAYGLFLVATDRAGNATPPPNAAQQPQARVEIDSKPPGVELLEPAAGAACRAGAAVPVRWRVADDHLDGASVDVELSSDGGRIWAPLAPAGWPCQSRGAGEGSFEWTVPSTDGDRYFLRVRATDAFGNKGEAASAKPFVIDSRPPTAAATGPATWASIEGDLFVSAKDDGLAGIDHVDVWTSTDRGATWTGPIGAPWADGRAHCKLPEGRVGVFARAVDRAGNAGAAPVPGTAPQATVAVDARAPRLTVTGVAAGDLFRPGKAISIAWEAVDEGLSAVPVRVEVQGPGGPAVPICPNAPAKGEASWTPATDGDYVIRVVASDEVGHEARFEAAIAVDGTAPKLTWAQAPDVAALRGGNELEIAWATDEPHAGDAPVTLSFSPDRGATWQPVRSELPACGRTVWRVPEVDCADGCLLRLSAADRIGNAAEAICPRPFAIVTNAPPVRLDLPVATRTGTLSAPLRWLFAREGFDRVEVWHSEDGGRRWALLSGMEAKSADAVAFDLPAGRHGFYIACARAGGHAEPPKSGTPPQQTLTVDDEPPTVTVLGAHAGDVAQAGGNVEIAWEVHDADLGPGAVSVLSRPTGGAWIESPKQPDRGSLSVPVPADAKGMEIRVVARDVAGNEAASGISLDVDADAPEVKVTSPVGKTVRGGEAVPVSWTARDSHLGDRPVDLRVSTDGGRRWQVVARNLPAAGQAVWTAPAATAQAVLLGVIVRDLAGRVESAQLPSAFAVDGAAPTTRIAPVGIVSSPDTRVECAADDDATGVQSIELWARPVGATAWERVGQAAVASATFPLTRPDGAWELVAVATDGAGNRSAAPDDGTQAMTTAVFDREGPALEVGALERGAKARAGGTLDLEWTACDANGIQNVWIESAERATGPRRPVRTSLPACGAVSIDLPLREGAMRFWVRAQDVAGHVASREIPVELTPEGPIVRITGLDGGSVWKGGALVHLAWKAEGAAGATPVTVWMGGEVVREKLPAEGTLDVRLPKATQDVVRLRVSAADATGAVGEACVSVSVDADAPRCEISAPAVSSDPSVRARVRAVDVGRAGVARIAVYGRGRGEASWRVLVDLPGDSARDWQGQLAGFTLPLDEGVTELFASACDRAGNAPPAPDGWTKPTWSVVVDTRAPRISLGALPAILQVAPGASVPVDWSVDDAHTAEGPVRLLLAAPGAAPRVLASGLPAKGHQEISLPVDLGDCLLTVEARDAAGNVGTSQVTFQVSERPIPLEITTPLAGATSLRGGTSVPLAWKIGPSTEAVSVSVLVSDGPAGPWQAIGKDLGATGEVTVPVPARDLDTFLVELEARQGTRSWVLAKYAVSVDVRAPRVRISAPAPSAQRRLRVPIDAQDDGPAGIARVTLLARPAAGGSWREVGHADGPASWPCQAGAGGLAGPACWVEVDLEEGRWDLAAVAEDAAGNRSPAPRDDEQGAVVAEVDTHGPVLLLPDAADVIPVAPGATLPLAWEAQDEHPSAAAVSIACGPEGGDLADLASGLPPKGTWEGKAPATEGTFRLRITARDALGNLSAAERVLRVEQRPDAPTADASVKDGDVVSAGTRVEFRWDAGRPELEEKGVAVLLSIDGGAEFRPIAEGLDRIGTFAWTPKDDLGATIVKVVARQRAGRWVEVLAPRRVTVRANRPRVTLAAQAAEGSRSVLLTPTVVEEGKGIASMNFWMTADGGRTWTDQGEVVGAVPMAIDVASDGRYGFSVSIKDSEGTSWDAAPAPGAAPQAVAVVDSTPPRVALKNFLGGEAYAGGATLLVWWEAEDALLKSDGVSLMLSSDSGKTWSPIAKGLRATGKFPWSLPRVTGAAFRLKVVAEDEAGRVGEAASERDFVIDSSLPAVEAAVPEAISTKELELAYRATGPSPSPIARVSAWITPDGGRTWSPAANASSPEPLKIVFPGEGTYGIALVAENAAGNAGRPPDPGMPPAQSVVVDLTPPQVKLTSPAAGDAIRPGQVEVRWEATDQRLADVPITILVSGDDGATWTPSEPMANTGRATVRTPAGAGSMRLRVVVRDAAGHEGTAEGGPWTLRTRPLAVKVTGVTTEGEVLYEADGGGFAIAAMEAWTSKDDGASWERSVRTEGADARPRVPLPESGLVGIWVVAEDEAGDRSPVPTPGAAPMWVTVIDHVAPVVKLLAPHGGEAFAGGKPAEVRWEAKDALLGDRPVHLYLSADGGRTWEEAGEVDGLPNSGRAQVALPARSGTDWRVRVTCVDLGGNVGLAEMPASFTVDAQVPSCRLAGPVRAAQAEVPLEGDFRDAGPAGLASADLYEWSGGRWVFVATFPDGQRPVFRAVDGRHALAIAGTDRVGNAQAPPTVESDAQCVVVVSTGGPAVALGPIEERLKGGSTVDVSWSCRGEEASSATIDWSSDGGATWKAAQAGLPPTGTYAWAVPRVDAADMRLRVTVADAHGRTGEAQAVFQVRSRGPAIHATFEHRQGTPVQAPPKHAVPQPAPQEAQRHDPPAATAQAGPSTGAQVAAPDLTKVRELYASGRHDDAAAECRRILAASPSCAEAHYRLAMCLVMRKEADEAAKEFEQATSCEPTNSEVRNAFGVMLLLEKDLDGAEKQFREALSHSEDATSHHNLGIVLYQKREYDAAREEFGRAIKLNPNAQDSIFYLAYLDIAVADWSKARERLDACIAIDPTSDTAAQARKALETIPK